MHNAGKYKSCSFVEYPEHNLNRCNLVTFFRTLVKKVEPVLGVVREAASLEGAPALLVEVVVAQPVLAVSLPLVGRLAAQPREFVEPRLVLRGPGYLCDSTTVAVLCAGVQFS
jgi:hypothetical protein